MSQDELAANDAVVADTTPTDTATVEQNNPAPQADDDGLESIKDIPLDESERQATDSPSDESDKEEAPQADETDRQEEASQQDVTPESPETTWDNLKGSSKERFEYMARRISELEAEKARFANEQDLLNEINPDTGVEYTPQEIERISWQQQRESQSERVNQELYELQVQQSQQQVNEEATKVTEEIPMLNPNSKEFDPEIGNYYADLLNDSLLYMTSDGQQANRATLLQYGINPDTDATLVGYTTSPYKLAKFAANSFERARSQGETLGQAKAQQANEKMLANADPSASAPGPSSGDDLDAIFDRVKNVTLS